MKAKKTQAGYIPRRKLAITDLIAYTKSLTDIIRNAPEDSYIFENHRIIRKLW